MPPVEEWSCFVTMEDRMVRSEETTDAQESSHDVSMPRIKRGFEDDEVVEVDRKVRCDDESDSREQAEVGIFAGKRWPAPPAARPMLRAHMLLTATAINRKLSKSYLMTVHEG